MFKRLHVNEKMENEEDVKKLKNPHTNKECIKHFNDIPTSTNTETLKDIKDKHVEINIKDIITVKLTKNKTHMFEDPSTND